MITTSNIEELISFFKKHICIYVIFITYMNYSFKNVLVTGSTGLLGSWLSEKLINENIEIKGIALDTSLNFLLESKNIADKFDNQYFDIADSTKVNDYFKKNKFDLIIHLAAQTQVRDAIDNPIKTFKSNIEGTWNILENCRNYNTPIVVASSDKAYGVSDKLPYKENFPLNGVFPYEFSKSATDMMCKTYKTTYELPVSVMRCGNIYGGGDLNWERLIPGVIKFLINNQRPVLRSDGKFKRDWVYVEDVVQAYLGVSNALVGGEKRVSESYNYSSTDYLSVMEVYEKICEAFSGRFVEPIIEENSQYEIKDQYLSSDLIFNELNITSQFTLKEALKNTIDWYKENLNNGLN